MRLQRSICNPMMTKKHATMHSDVVNFSHPLRKERVSIERGSIEVGGRFPAFIGGTDCDLAAGQVSP